MKKGLLTLLLLPFLTAAQTKTAVVLLGTGVPRPSMTASGPATAIVVSTVQSGKSAEGTEERQRVFLVDAGPGVERQLSGANLPIDGVTAVFFTHLHSDHTLGYPDLIFTSWVMGRKTPLQAYGPRGLQKMTDHLIEAFAEDIEVRTEGLEHETPGGYKVDVHEIAERKAQSPGPIVVYDSLGVRVSAIPVPHGSWKEAYGYRFDTPDRSIVISGDTRYSESLIEASKGVDVLVHEVYSSARLKSENLRGKDWPQYMKEFHTSDVELGKLAAIAKPKLLLLTHLGRQGASGEELLKGIREGGFDGQVVVGHDLGRW